MYVPGVVVSWVLMSAEARVGFTGFLGLGFGRDLRDDILLLVSGGEGRGVLGRRVKGKLSYDRLLPGYFLATEWLSWQFDYCRLLYTLCVLLGLCLLLLLRVNLRLLQLLLYLTDDPFNHHPVRSVKENGGEGKRRELSSKYCLLNVHSGRGHIGAAENEYLAMIEISLHYFSWKIPLQVHSLTLGTCKSNPLLFTSLKLGICWCDAVHHKVAVHSGRCL